MYEVCLNMNMYMIYLHRSCSNSAYVDTIRHRDMYETYLVWIDEVGVVR